MNCEFINREGNPKLILIFGGWSTDTSFYSNIQYPGWDIMVVTGYSDFNFPVEILEEYSTISLFAWSLGVFAASLSIPFERIAISVAINGTESPVDNFSGIPEEIYIGTESNLNDRNLLKFHKRMCGESFKEISSGFPNQNIEILRKELYHVRNTFANRDDSTRSSRWDKVYIGKNDMIFPASNQINAWNRHLSSPDISVIDAPHYIDLFKIIRASLPITEKVASRFKKALPTYDAAATPQKVIAQRLAELVEERKIGHMMEIGTGSGVFTKIIAGKLHPDIIEFIDLYQLEKFKLAPEEHYHIGDGESLINEFADSYPKSIDAIVSASSIQWFLDSDRFFKNASRLIKDNGFLLCSTFSPSNLHELKNVNPFGIIYRSKNRIENSLSRYFKDFVVIEDSVTIEFENPRELLLHLQHTGVGGSSTSALSLSQLLPSLPLKLTYTPIYILASSPL